MRSSVNVSTHESVTPALARLNAAIDDVAQQPGWSYDRVAREAGFHPMTLNSLRWGKTPNPSERVLRGLDRVLGFEEGKGAARILAGKSPIKVKKANKANEAEVDPYVAQIEATGLKREQKDVLISIYLNAVAAQGAVILDQAREMEEKQRGA